MIGKRTKQSQLFDVGNVYDLELPTSSFCCRTWRRAKTRCQLLMACTVANLRRVWNWVADQQIPQPVMAAA